MNKLKEIKSKKVVLNYISESGVFGNLGVFIGAGFSKAVLNRDNNIALSWGELLEKASEKLGLDYSSFPQRGVSYPELASNICEELSKLNKAGYNESLTNLKRELASLTSWYPEQESRKEYSEYIKSLDLDWIITTNYDLVLESLLTGKCAPIGPDEALCAPKEMIPIYHLHGMCSNPDSIIISQEDYISLFRPNEYRQLKLALTIKESTVLLLGYGLGDVNVLTALDWSKNVFETSTINYPNEVIQVVRKANPSDVPYRDKNGIIIYETEELSTFFSEFIKENEVYLKQKEKMKTALHDLSTKLENPEKGLIDRFIDEEDYRKNIITILSMFTSPMILGFISFLNKVFDETWKRASVSGNFEAYNENLVIQLDILTIIPTNTIPPALLEMLAYNFDKVGSYIGSSIGKSYSAANTFHLRKEDIPKELVKELLNIGEQHYYNYLRRLMKKLI